MAEVAQLVNSWVSVGNKNSYNLTGNNNTSNKHGRNQRGSGITMIRNPAYVWADASLNTYCTSAPAAHSDILKTLEKRVPKWKHRGTKKDRERKAQSVISRMYNLNGIRDPAYVPMFNSNSLPMPMSANNSSEQSMITLSDNFVRKQKKRYEKRNYSSRNSRVGRGILKAKGSGGSGKRIKLLIDDSDTRDSSKDPGRDDSSTDASGYHRQATQKKKKKKAPKQVQLGDDDNEKTTNKKKKKKKRPPGVEDERMGNKRHSPDHPTDPKRKRKSGKKKGKGKSPSSEDNIGRKGGKPKGSKRKRTSSEDSASNKPKEKMQHGRKTGKTTSGDRGDKRRDRKKGRTSSVYSADSTGSKHRGHKRGKTKSDDSADSRGRTHRGHKKRKSSSDDSADSRGEKRGGHKKGKTSSGDKAGSKGKKRHEVKKRKTSSEESAGSERGKKRKRSIKEIEGRHDRKRSQRSVLSKLKGKKTIKGRAKKGPDKGSSRDSGIRKHGSRGSLKGGPGGKARGRGKGSQQSLHGRGRGMTEGVGRGRGRGRGRGWKGHRQGDEEEATQKIGTGRRLHDLYNIGKGFVGDLLNVWRRVASYEGGGRKRDPSHIPKFVSNRPGKTYRSGRHYTVPRSTKEGFESRAGTETEDRHHERGKGNYDSESDSGVNYEDELKNLEGRLEELIDVVNAQGRPTRDGEAEGADKSVPKAKEMPTAGITQVFNMGGAPAVVNDGKSTTAMTSKHLDKSPLDVVKLSGTGANPKVYEIPPPPIYQYPQCYYQQGTLAWQNYLSDQCNQQIIGSIDRAACLAALAGPACRCKRGRCSC